MQLSNEHSSEAASDSSLDNAKRQAEELESYRAEAQEMSPQEIQGKYFESK